MYSETTDRCRVTQLLHLWNVGGMLGVVETTGPGGIGEYAYALTEPTTEAPGEFYIDWFFTTPPGQLYPRAGRFVITAYMKANGRTWGWLDAGDGTIDRFAYFDLESGATGQTSGSDIFSSIEAVGGGWYRCTMSGEALPAEGVPSDAGTVSIGPADSDGGFGYIGNGTGIKVFGVAFDAPGTDVEPYDPG